MAQTRQTDKAYELPRRRDGQTQQAFGRNIIMAGGIGTPRLLHASDLHPAHSSFFSDPVIAVMGHVDDIDGGAEVPMAAGLYLQREGIALADMTLPKPMYQAFATQVGRLDRLAAHAGTLTIMAKIRDDIGGSIGPHWVDKTLTAADRSKLAASVIPQPWGLPPTLTLLCLGKRLGSWL